jgi:4-oxalocrotonate tautomerase
MAVITVQMFDGRTPEQKRALVKEVTEAFVRTCAGKPEDTWVIINEVPREHWSLAGELYSER